MNCVFCSTTMDSVTLEDNPAHMCPKGHGIWIEQEPLGRILDAFFDYRSRDEEEAALAKSASRDPEVSSGRFHNCPICQKTLRKDIYRHGSGVVVDSCDEHGVWLDPGELSRLEAWSEGMQRTWDEMVSEAREAKA